MIKTYEAETLLSITVYDTVICTVLVKPSPACTGNPILPGLIIVVCNVADTTFIVIDVCGEVCLHRDVLLV